jgi:hypothetical protein
MIEHAMRFDADGDGKLDRTELTKMFEQMQAMRTRGGPGGGPRAGGPRTVLEGPDGFRGRPEGSGPPREGRGQGGPGFGPGNQGRGPADGPQRDRNEL